MLILQFQFLYSNMQLVLRGNQRHMQLSSVRRKFGKIAQHKVNCSFGDARVNTILAFSGLSGSRS
ncbi:MAG: hypothetical protein WC806_05040, partial [Candidatus Gracilibacteria bacterium]